MVFDRIQEIEEQKVFKFHSLFHSRFKFNFQPEILSFKLNSRNQNLLQKNSSKYYFKINHIKKFIFLQKKIFKKILLLFQNFFFQNLINFLFFFFFRLQQVDPQLEPILQIRCPNPPENVRTFSLSQGPMTNTTITQLKLFITPRRRSAAGPLCPYRPPFKRPKPLNLR